MAVPTRADRNQRLSVVVSDQQKAELEAIARRASFELEADITLSDLVRDAIAQFLSGDTEPRVRRIAEEKTRYD